MDPSFIGSYDRHDERLHIYPNPATSSIIKIEDAEGDIMLYNSEGRLISKFENEGGYKMDIDISSIRKGVYILKSGNKSVRLVVLK